MLHDHFHDVLAIGAAVGTETPGMNAERAHHLEETAVSLCLLEAHVTVAVAILQIGNQPTDGELATALRVSPRALRDYRNEGILPYIRMKGNILYRESDVERVLRRCIRGKMTLQSG